MFLSVYFNFPMPVICFFPVSASDICSRPQQLAQLSQSQFISDLEFGCHLETMASLLRT